VLSITFPLSGLDLSVCGGRVTCYNFSKKTRNVLFVNTIEEDLVLVKEVGGALFVDTIEEDLVLVEEVGNALFVNVTKEDLVA